VPVQIGKAGTGAREMARKRMLRIYGCVLALWVAGSILVLAGNKLLCFDSYFVNLVGWLGFAFGTGLLIAVVKALSGKGKDELNAAVMRAVKGAKAEEKVSEVLEGLPRGYAVFNDFPCPMGNIDHIVIGPTRVFVIETKSHSGEITLSADGELLRDSKPLEKDFLKQVLGQCFWLKEKLAEPGGKAPFVNPVVAFTRAFVKVHQPVKGVRILNKKWLVKHIAENNARIEREELDRIFYRLLDLKSEAAR